MRKTYVFDHATGKVVPKGARRAASGGFAMPDINEFQTVDGVAIGSRSALRAYQRETGLEQIGNDTVAGRNADGSLRGRLVEELPSARYDVEEAMRRHS
jgi:hypothetical protein